ncbi:SAM-dependent methyltransferase [Anaeroselena agilis]|uniref:Class I SAM-dependent methyltransferase n=1 Tax=Anaeroselena agilis TaxID=3063788 RepID=A0ABU3P0F1_9FIRM|nr:class I SAM-dependent methyltransferase [Selenomonadales bacterium 4137-cl]
MTSIGKLIHRYAGRLLGGGDRALHDWVLAQLDIRPDDAILEIGCGPDAAMKRILKAHKGVFVVGVDASADAVGEAWRKNARAVRAGRAMLVQTDITRGLPAFAAPFARVVAVNAPLPDDRAADIFKAARAAMAPGGKLAVAARPPEKEASEAYVRLLGKEIRRQLEAAGFATVRLHEKTFGSSAAVCVTGVNPSPTAKGKPGGHRQK